MKHPIPINESEAVIHRFFDAQRCRLSEWSFTCDTATGGKLTHNYFATNAEWQAGGGGTTARLEQSLDVDVSGYDGLILCIALPGTATVSVSVVVDGKRQTPLRAVKGTFQTEEYEGRFHGRVLSNVTIEIADTGSAPTSANIYWLGVFHGQRRQDMLARPNPYRDGWDDLVVPAGKQVAAIPQLGLFFDAADVESLRRRAATEPYKTLVGKMRECAVAQLGKEPWRGVGPFPNMMKPRCYRLRGEAHISGHAMRFGAFVGLLDNDERLMRMAVDHALALAHCDHWQMEFMSTIPGSSWEQRAFYEYRFAHNSIYALDWAGSYLTEAGRQVILQAISVKALPWILQSLMRHPYVRGCNQGTYFAWGAIICELALSRRYPYATELLDAAVTALDQTVNAYVAPDGGTFEGVGYASASVSHALMAYYLVARHRKVPFESLVPPPLKKFCGYLEMMLSTVPPYGGALHIADCGSGRIYEECVPALFKLTGAPSLPALMTSLMEMPGLHDFGECPGPMCSVIIGPDRLPPAGAQPPVFRILDHTGMLCSCRPTSHGPVRLQLVGGPANAGHSHEDRGSILLEAFGEEIAIDRGQTDYGDPRSTMLTFARYHNVLIPESPEGLFPRQINPCPAATIPTGEGDEQVLRAEIDVTAAWGTLTTRCIRRIESDEPTVLTVIDEVELAEPGRVSFNLHSKHPWTRTEQGWITNGKKAQLCVTPEWTPESESGDEDFIDGEKKPVFHLVLVAPRAGTHLLRTRLTLRAVDGP